MSELELLRKENMKLKQDIEYHIRAEKEMTQTYKVQVSMNQAHIVESGFVWKQGDFGFNIEIGN